MKINKKYIYNSFTLFTKHLFNIKDECKCCKCGKNGYKLKYSRQLTPFLTNIHIYTYILRKSLTIRIIDFLIYNIYNIYTIQHT